jgi:hypothetical protein
MSGRRLIRFTAPLGLLGGEIINDGVDHLSPKRPLWRLVRFSFGAHGLVALAHARERVAGRRTPATSQVGGVSRHSRGVLGGARQL